MSGGDAIFLEPDDLSIECRFGAVPINFIEDARLGAAAIRVGAWVMVQPLSGQWRISISEMLRRLCMSKGAWLRARKQLIECGYLVAPETRRRARKGEVNSHGDAFKAGVFVSGGLYILRRHPVIHPA